MATGLALPAGGTRGAPGSHLRRWRVAPPKLRRARGGGGGDPPARPRRSPSHRGAMLGGPDRGAGRLRIRERTKLVLLEIDTVACCSPGAGMAAGCRPEPPWSYRRIAGEFA